MRSLGVAFVATRSPVPHGAARTWRGATPQAEGLVRARGQVCFHTLAPALRGSFPVHGSLELEDYQPTVLINAQKVNVSGRDRNLSANQRESAHQHVGVRHQNGFQHLFRLNPLGEAELGSGPGCPVDFPDPDASLHTILSNMSHSPPLPRR